jgi:pseudouridine-5'-monophosphatase
MMLTHKARYVLFDMDGVLLDTENFYTEATQQIVARWGKTFDWSLKQNMVGRPAIESARYLVDALDLPITPEEYLTEREDGLRTRMPQAQPMPGAVALTRQLQDRGVPMAVATSSSREFFALKTTHHGDWFARFDTIIVGDDPRVAHGKPAPDIFLVAAEALGANPQDCLVVEDSPAGVEAAHAAQMQVLAVPYPGMNPERLQSADLLLESLEGVNAADLTLPA